MILQKHVRTHRKFTVPANLEQCFVVHLHQYLVELQPMQQDLQLIGRTQLWLSLQRGFN
jgi:hypothetical protein